MLWERIFSRFELKIIPGKKKASMICIRPLKEKENEGGERKFQLNGQWKVPLLGGPWKVLCLVAFGRFHYLVANGRKRKNTFSLLPIFPLTILLKPSFFPLILRFYFIMVLGRLLMHFLPFLWSINYNPASWCNKSFTHSLLIWFDWKSLFLSLKLWCCIWPPLTSFKLHKWMNNWI